MTKRFADHLGLVLAHTHAVPPQAWPGTWGFDLHATPTWHAAAGNRPAARPLRVHDWEDGSDLTVSARMDRASHRVPVVRVESETANWWRVADDLEDPDRTGNHNDYAWDFWKLLRAQAPVRLFVALVGGRDNGTMPQRIGMLEVTISAILVRHGYQLRAGEALYAIILPRAGSIANGARLLAHSGGDLQPTWAHW